MIICDAFCQCQDKVANVLTYALLELKYISGKMEKSLFYQISDKPTSKNLLLMNHLPMMEKWKYNSHYLQVFGKNWIGRLVDKQSW